MTINPLGRVNVLTPAPRAAVDVHHNDRLKNLFQVIPGLTGKTYIGKAGMNKATLAGVTRILWPNTSGGFSEGFFLETSDGADSLRLSDYVVDADVAGEGLLVTFWQE
jgi:hypothetical protein